MEVPGFLCHAAFRLTKNHLLTWLLWSRDCTEDEDPSGLKFDYSICFM